jgi:hypothetical protein
MLIDEALNLAYHGARAGSEFQHHAGALERDFGDDKPTGHYAGVPEHLQQRPLRGHESRAQWQRYRLRADAKGFHP